MQKVISSDLRKNKRNHKYIIFFGVKKLMKKQSGYTLVINLSDLNIDTNELISEAIKTLGGTKNISLLSWARKVAENKYTMAIGLKAISLATANDLLEFGGMKGVRLLPATLKVEASNSGGIGVGIKKESKQYESDSMRKNYIEMAKKKKAYPEKDVSVGQWDLVRSEDWVIVINAGDKIIYYEYWGEPCWVAIYQKPEYKGLTHNEAVDKFMADRFPSIAASVGESVIGYTYTEYDDEGYLSEEVGETLNDSEDYVVGTGAENGILRVEITNGGGERKGKGIKSEKEMGQWEVGEWKELKVNKRGEIDKLSSLSLSDIETIKELYRQGIVGEIDPQVAEKSKEIILSLMERVGVSPEELERSRRFEEKEYGRFWDKVNKKIEKLKSAIDPMAILQAMDELISTWHSSDQILSWAYDEAGEEENKEAEEIYDVIRDIYDLAEDLKNKQYSTVQKYHTKEEGKDGSKISASMRGRVKGEKYDLDMGKYQRQFIEMLKNKYPNGVDLHHQTSRENVKSILENGLRAEDTDLGIVYTVLGEKSYRAMNSNSPDSVDIEIMWPVAEYDKLYPEEETYGESSEGEEGVAEDDRADLIFKHYIESHPDLIGGDIVIDNSISKDRIVNKEELELTVGDEEHLTSEKVGVLIRRGGIVIRADYDHGSVQTSDIPKELKQWIKKVQNSIPKEDLSDAESNEMDGGFPPSPHTTLCYGIDSASISDIQSLVANRQLIAKIAKIDYFTHSKEYDVAVLKLESQDLKELHSDLAKEFEVKDDFDYTPHITIAYLKKGKKLRETEELVDEEPEIEWQIKEIELSKKDTTIEKFEIEGRLKEAAKGNLGAYWIDPVGKIYNVGVEESTGEHEEWIFNNIEMLKEEYGITIPEYNNKIEALILLGWTRVRMEQNNLMGVEVENVDTLRKWFDIIINFKPRKILVETFAQSEDGFYSIEEFIKKYGEYRGLKRKASVSLENITIEDLINDQPGGEVDEFYQNYPEEAIEAFEASKKRFLGFTDPFPVFRALAVKDVQEFVKSIKDELLLEDWPSMGVYWTWDLGQATVYENAKGESNEGWPEVVVKGEVSKQNVDWIETLQKNTGDADIPYPESEIKLIPGSKVMINEIKDMDTGEVYSMNGGVVVEAGRVE